MDFHGVTQRALEVSRMTAGACWDEYNDTSDACFPPFERELGAKRIEAYEDCEERLAPEFE